MKPLPHVTQSFKSLHQRRVEALMNGIAEKQTALGLPTLQAVPSAPVIPSLETRLLRASLILEEAVETIRALGAEVTVELEEFSEPAPCTMQGYRQAFQITQFRVVPSADPPDFLEVIDGCCDISVVTTGTLSAFGIPDFPFLSEVDRNNLSKLENGTMREDGKLIKPSDHKPPRIEEMLKLLCHQANQSYLKTIDPDRFERNLS